MDETGIDSYYYREYGYSPEGQPVHGRIRGRKYARTGIVAAQMGDAIIAPCQYSGTMNHELFEDWFENTLLPALPEGTVIVMDNASFHRKKQLYCLAQEHGCYVREPRKVCVKRNKRHPFSQESEQENNLIERMYYYSRIRT